MIETQFDIKKVNAFKDLLVRIRHGESPQSIQKDFEKYFKEVSEVNLLLIIQELLNGDYGVTIEDIKKFYSIYTHLNDEAIFDSFDQSHPVQIFRTENRSFQSLLEKIDLLLEVYETQENDAKNTINDLRKYIHQLGEFQKHYRRKEHLFFSILERFNHHVPTRIMWRQDDRNYALYKGVKRQIDQLPQVDLNHVLKTYSAFKKEFYDMIFQEEEIILPILVSLFSDDDWSAIAEESDAFGYALIEIEEQLPQRDGWRESSSMEVEEYSTRNFPFDSGYLTLEEANLILNNLPLEITFVDKNSIFKYFNNITKASDMMFIRTPVSLGRNVANCHPPKSLKKVMTIVRDLKTKKRTSESMWFKKGDQYIHTTFKAIFNEKDEFLGILEYVQDIQPFFELPSEVKTGLTKLDE